MKLTEHFSVEEFEFSQTAVREGIDNRLPAELYDNARRICTLLEEARAILRKPITITSGYRSPALNKVVPGSSKTSAHTQALAADFVSPSFGTPLEITEVLTATLKDFDQLIYEGTWVHIGLMKGTHQRRQVLTAKFNQGRVSYLPGIVA